MSPYPALTHHLLPAIEHAGRVATHPIVDDLTTGGIVRAQTMRVLDNLVASAAGVDGFDRLVRKLAEAPDLAAFWSAVTELIVVSRLVRLGATDVGVVPTSKEGRPDSVGTIRSHKVYFEVTRLTSVNPRQRAQNELLDALAAAVEAIPSPFDISFVPAGEYDKNAIAAITATIRETMLSVEAAGTLAAGGAEAITFAAPPFGLYVSLKAGRSLARPGTRFRLTGEPVFPSPERHDEGKLLDTITWKYRQRFRGALNVLVIHLVGDGLDEAAQTTEFLAERPRPDLTAVVLLSSWPGRSRILRNPGASPQPPTSLLDALTGFCEIDDEMWTRSVGG